MGKNIIKSGQTKIENATLLGQYTSPHGVYYGGNTDEASTKMMKAFLQESLSDGYKNIIHIDLHTGYGPKNTLTVFNSSLDNMTYEEASREYNYAAILTKDSEGFYATTGDINGYFYEISKDKYDQKSFYSTCFEFGTLGDSTPALLSSLKNTIDENNLYWNKTENRNSEFIVSKRYLEMFYPYDKEWQQKAMDDFRSAMRGVLNARLLK